jgi:beta-lactamase regulating signal transducer with metallopeptidase domain
MALENILSQEIVQQLGWTLLHFVWQATAVALVLAILLAGLRKAAPSVRYNIACAALALMVLLPVLTMPLVPVSPPQPMANIEPPPASAVAPLQPAQETPLARVTDYEEPVRPESSSTPMKIPWKQRFVERLEPALPYLVTGWVIGVFGLSLWHLGGWAQLQRLRRKLIKPVDASLRAGMRELAGRLGVRRAVELLESALVQVPTVVGWLRPVILLPASALTGLSADQLEALLAHELAHIRRCDSLVNILQTVIETLGFYHPAVWWVSHRIRIERENCCDDLAVTICGDRLRYARALTSMEEIRSGRSEFAVAASGGNLHIILFQEAVEKLAAAIAHADKTDTDLLVRPSRGPSFSSPHNVQAQRNCRR